MSCERKTIIIVSDGNNRPVPSSPDYARMIARANAFKTSGGIIICVGIRAGGDGYKALRELCTPGFFLNVFGAGTTPVTTAITQLAKLAGLYCAAASQSITWSETNPDSVPLEDNEGMGALAPEVPVAEQCPDPLIVGDGIPTEAPAKPNCPYIYKDRETGGLFVWDVESQTWI